MASRFRKSQPVRRALLEARIFKGKLGRHWRVYLIQCGMAALALFLVLSANDVVLHAAMVVAIASTVFIVFMRPHGRGSGPRRVIGGHLVAVLVGTAFWTLNLTAAGDHLIWGSHVARDLAAVAAVGLSILIMVLTSTEHPPAAGTAVSLVAEGWAVSAVVFVLMAAVLLCVLHRFLRSRLVNLF